MSPLEVVRASEVFFLDYGAVSSKMGFLGDRGRGLNYSEQPGGSLAHGGICRQWLAPRPLVGFLPRTLKLGCVVG